MSGLLKYAERGIISFTGIEKSTALLDSFPDMQKLCKHRGTAHHLLRFPKGIQSLLGAGFLFADPPQASNLRLTFQAAP